MNNKQSKEEFLKHTKKVYENGLRKRYLSK